MNEDSVPRALSAALQASISQNQNSIRDAEQYICESASLCERLSRATSGGLLVLRIGAASCVGVRRVGPVGKVKLATGLPGPIAPLTLW